MIHRSVTHTHTDTLMYGYTHHHTHHTCTHEGEVQGVSLFEDYYKKIIYSGTCQLCLLMNNYTKLMERCMWVICDSCDTELY